MNKIEKIKQAIAGQKISQIPFSFWTHFPEFDRDPEIIAQASYEIFKQFDLDFIKTMNNGMYAVEDYNTQVDYSDIAKGGVAKIISSPIYSIEDWANIPYLEINQAPTLQRELEYLEKILKLVDGQAPVIMTIFSPLTTADKLSKGLLLDHISQNTQQAYIHQALDNIARTTALLAKKAINMGAAGIYFASQMSSYDKISEEKYLEYGRPYDLKVLEAANKGWFNTIHAHGDDIMFDLLKDYPVDVFNWHIWESLPELKEGMDFANKAIMGGIARMDITHNNKNRLRNQIYQSIMTSEGKNFILTPGCGIRHPFNEETIRYILKVKKETEAILQAK